MHLFQKIMAELGAHPWMQGVALALSTFILEDPATIAAGLLVADARLGFQTAFIGLAAGIAVGDLGLYGIGRIFGPSLIGKGPLSVERYKKASSWFGRNVIQAVFLSRFVPGMRLPTYVAAGILRAPFCSFLASAILASLGWVFLLLHLTVAFGEDVAPLLGRWRWQVGGMAILVFILLQRRMAGRMMKEDRERLVSSFEFWPPWLFYIPVFLYWIRLALRYRSLSLPTAANPGIFMGGFIGESKSEILDLVPLELRNLVAEWICLRRREATEVSEDELGMALREMRDARLGFPVVAKPDVGQRGAGVQRLDGPDELRTYIRAFPPGERFLLQELAGGGVLEPQEPGFSTEAGVMWWRRPGSAQGEIPSITLKVFPVLKGNGRSRLKALIDADPRARRLADIYGARHREQLERVPDEGELIPLVFSGNHCQGTIFKDGTSLLRPKLAARIEEIASAIPGFDFGRFDIRFDVLEDFLRGENFKIIEINGASAEATHIWDAEMTLIEAYRVLFEQFRVLFEIGDARRQQGYAPVGLRALLAETLRYRRRSARYPETA